MNFSIFDLYQAPSAKANRLHEPYTYPKFGNSKAVPESPDSLRWSESPKSPAKKARIPMPCTDSATPIDSVESSPLPEGSVSGSLPVLDKHKLKPPHHAPKKAKKVKPQKMPHRPSKSIVESHSYAENKIYWESFTRHSSKLRLYQNRASIGDSKECQRETILPLKLVQKLKKTHTKLRLANCVETQPVELAPGQSKLAELSKGLISMSVCDSLPDSQSRQCSDPQVRLKMHKSTSLANFEDHRGSLNALSTTLPDIYQGSRQR